MNIKIVSTFANIIYIMYTHKHTYNITLTIASLAYEYLWPTQTTVSDRKGRQKPVICVI